MLTVTFRSKELLIISESSTISLVCHNCEPDIVVLNRFVPFRLEFVEIEFVSRLLLNIVDVVTSEFCSVESLIVEFVEFEFVRVEL